jgi:hypothetical protein
VQVGLDCDSDPIRLRARPTKQLESRIDVGRAFHVDPEEVVALGRPFHQPVEVLLAHPAVQVEAELCRLHRDVRVEPHSRHTVQHVQIMLRHLLGFGGIGDVLTEPGEDCGDAKRLQFARGLQGIFDALAGHEPGHRSPDEGRLRCALTQPHVGGTGEERLSHQSHRGCSGIATIARIAEIAKIYSWQLLKFWQLWQFTTRF